MMIAIFPVKVQADVNIPITVNKEYNYNSLVEQYGSNVKNKFQFSLSEPGRIRFLIRNVNKPQRRTLYLYGLPDANMRFLTTPYTEYEDSLYISLDKGTYAINFPEVSSNNNTVITVQFEAASSNSFIEKEPNNSFDTANLVSLNQKYEGDILYSHSDKYKKEDYYKFQLDRGGKISLITKNIGSDLAFESGTFILYSEDEYGNTQEIARQSMNTDGSEVEYMYLRLPKGTYYLSVQSKLGNYDNINYSFKINYTAESAETHEEEVNDYSSQANQKEVNQSYIGNISSAEDNDCFRFKITQLSVCSMVLNIPRQTAGDTFRA